MSEFFGDALDNYGTDYMWKDVIPLTKSADYSLFNLETSVSERGKSVKPSGFGFRSSPGHLTGMADAGIDMVNLANNHVMDYGMDAFKDTLFHLEENKIRYIGAGNNFEEASQIKYETINGTTLGFFAANAIIPSKTWIASDLSGGVMPLKEKYYETMFQIIQSADEKCDYLIVNLHWGTEYSNQPSQNQIDLARTIIDAGADMIAGSHPHVLQGVEYYKNAVIFYSIGNFVFYKNSYDSGLTGLFEVEVSGKNLIHARIYPVSIDNLKANIHKPDDKLYKEIIENINERSEMFGVSADSNGFLKRDLTG